MSTDCDKTIVQKFPQSQCTRQFLLQYPLTVFQDTRYVGSWSNDSTDLRVYLSRPPNGVIQ